MKAEIVTTLSGGDARTLPPFTVFEYAGQTYLKVKPPPNSPQFMAVLLTDKHAGSLCDFGLYGEISPYEILGTLVLKS